MGRSAQRSEPVNDQQRHELHARAVKARRRAEQREQARLARELAERLERLPVGRMDDPEPLPRVD